MKRLALGALLLCGCPLTHGDYPGRACATSDDCFKGQGEVCNQTTRQCEIAVDAGVDRPSVDRPPVDAETDAEMPDGVNP